MADLQKYKKNEKNKEKSAKHRAFVIICLVTNALNGVKTRLQIAAKGFCLLRRCIQLLRAEGIEPVSYWYNPNIHPYQEYKARRDTLMAYAPSVGVELIVQEDYGLRDFCRAVAEDIDHRCGRCYRLRLEQTARYAAEHGFQSFSSTLFVSPYQDHELLRQTAEEVSAQYGVTFLYRDFRPGFRQGQQEARELGLYMQKYCGCVFSEEDRYAKQISRDMQAPEKHL